MTKRSHDYNWAVLKAGGEVIEGTGSPRKHLGDPGDLLMVMRTGGNLVLAPSDEGKIRWITTVDANAANGEIRRRVAGPGIESPHTVRCWFTGSGDMILTDGPFELSIRAAIRINEAAAARQGV